MAHEGPGPVRFMVMVIDRQIKIGEWSVSFEPILFVYGGQGDFEKIHPDDFRS